MQKKTSGTFSVSFPIKFNFLIIPEFAQSSLETVHRVSFDSISTLVLISHRVGSLIGEVCFCVSQFEVAEDTALPLSIEVPGIDIWAEPKSFHVRAEQHLSLIHI